ncbi:hypothetical protein BT96DRAFT_810155 [Gymnopus androsaceus JB14]|uniref:Uncharacterized protein n=1 Tax=Gymnopus androsaceus JB14 TaxID=1447944 RepID=A0A6A4ICF0_9AGAR|nr:hypothetical protein BT96DRAFT_810155 [Gymnopus androsaceus JB14]
MPATSKTDQTGKARQVFIDISTKHIDWPEAIWEAWILFEHFHGSVKQVEGCLDKIEKARYQVSARRTREAENAIYQATTEAQANSLPVCEIPIPTTAMKELMNVDQAPTSRGKKCTDICKTFVLCAVRSDDYGYADNISKCVLYLSLGQNSDERSHPKQFTSITR